ncbi:MAG: hypothetical protein WKF73_01100 [Nocardioidaceae bacterium]
MALARLAELGDEVEDAVEPAEDEEVAAARGEADPAQHAAPRGRARRCCWSSGLKSVIDLGCGPGQFLERLVKTSSFTRIAGSDVSARSLQHAARRLHVDRMSERQSERDRAVPGCAHLRGRALRRLRRRRSDGGRSSTSIQPRLEALEQRRVRCRERPGSVIVTTPNGEYNALYEGLVGMRHPDHRFEWTRERVRRMVRSGC